MKDRSKRTLVERLNPFSAPEGKHWWDWDKNARQAPVRKRTTGGGGGGGFQRTPRPPIGFREAVREQTGVAKAQQRYADVKSGKAARSWLGRPQMTEARATIVDQYRQALVERGPRDPQTVELAHQLEQQGLVDVAAITAEVTGGLWADVSDPEAVEL